MSMTGERQAPVPAPVPFWPKPLSIFGLPEVTTLSTRAPVCTIPPIPPPLRLMLAETPSPHGAGASRVTVIPGKPPSPVITVSSVLAFRKHRCENTPLT